MDPLKFSNGKTQEDVVNEVIEAINKGEQIIFIHGVCGTGKSAIALNIAKELGKTSIVVPGKNLQAQYKKDYEGNKFLKKENGENLNIAVITGRNNHTCKFLQDNEDAIPRATPNASLNDIFARQKNRAEELKDDDPTANNINLPCKIEIKEKNWYRLKEYLKQNQKVDMKEINTIKDIKRLGVGAVCPYWSPVLPTKIDLKKFGEKQRTYEGLDGTTYIQYKRKPGCAFYEQFDSYIDADVIVFNALKYKLETALSRKPKTEVEIIDECDEFLDGLSNQRSINIEKLQSALMQAMGSAEGDEYVIEELFELINYFKKDKRIQKTIQEKEIIPLKATGIYDILKLFLEEEWLETIDDESYVMEVVETAKMFKEFIEESYIAITKNENATIVHIVTTNLAKKVEELVKKNKRVILMSGTIHSDQVLRNIFGIKNFTKIDAEVEDQGEMKIKRTGKEKDCKYANFSNGNITRKEYLEALDNCIEEAQAPVLVHVNAYSDLPTSEELVEYDLVNLIAREDLKEEQRQDGEGKIVKEFKEGQREILFSTRDARGVDFPGEECRSIVFTKYPNPNAKDLFWKILAKTNPNAYWEFYKDKAKREFKQKIYRGLRFKEDWVYVLSPDSRVLDEIERIKN